MHMLWYSWLMIGIVCIGILYMIADKLVIPIYRYHRNKKRAARWVWCTFFHPAGNFPQRMLCKPDGAHFIEVPKDHLEFFPETEDGKPPKYCLIGTEVVGEDADKNPIEHPIRLTQRDVWPPGVKEAEQVVVESAYFMIGRQEALNPYRDFMAINTELTQLIIRDERSMEAINKQQNREIENWENIETSMVRLVKNQTYMLIGVFVAAGSGTAAAILSYMASRQGA